MARRYLIALAAAAALAGQPFLKPGSVEGVVVNSITNLPVKKAVVVLRGVLPGNYRATSNENGAFTFSSLEPDAYRIEMVTAQGYQFQPPRNPAEVITIAVAEDQHVAGVKRLPLGLTANIRST